MAAPVASPKNPPPAPGGSAVVRQLALVGVLAVLLGVLATDYFVVKPKSEAAMKNLDTLVDEKNRAGIAPGEEGAKRDRNAHLVTSSDIHKWMGWGPSKTVAKSSHKVEYYSFWGAMPLPRHFICVVYRAGKDGEPDLYSSHYLNPKSEDLEPPLDPTQAPPPKVDPNAAPPSGEPRTRDVLPPVNPSNEGETEKPAEPTEKPSEPSEKPAEPEKTPAEPPAAPAEESAKPAPEEDAK